MKSVCCITSEVCNLPSYDGLGDINTFINGYEKQVPENQRLLALDIALKSIPTRWWSAHKKHIGDWQECRWLMRIRFGQINTKIELKYDGETNLREHIQLCTTT